MTRRQLAPAPQGDLFGRPKTPPKDATPVTLAMVEIPPGTDKAWLLRPEGIAKGRTGFAARSECRRGDGDRARFFTMPRWLAAERGWL